MLEFLCSIPDEIGWALVGAVAMLTFQMFCLLMWQVAIQPLVCSIKEWWAFRKEMKEVTE